MNIEREKIILRNIQYNELFARKVIPFIKEEYFLQDDERLFFSRLYAYFIQYNKLPTMEAMVIDINSQVKVPQPTVDGALKLVEDFNANKSEPIDDVWLLDQTEEFCKDQALYLATMEIVQIQSSTDKNARLTRTAIPAIMQKALAVSFDTNVGHNYLEGFDARYDFYTQKSHKVPTHLATINMVTNGGPPRKTLNCVAAQTNAGKSILLCDLAANYMRMGYNVIYFTMEMEEMKISQRIDANLMDLDINQIDDKISKEQWAERANGVKSKCKGRLIVKEYPTSSANASHFRYALQELKQKQNFVPDVILVDYINICASVRYKNAAESYGYMKGVTEELRGLMVEFNAVGWTGVQFNRGGMNNSDADMTNLSESMGIAHTLDFLIALIIDDDMIAAGQVMFKQLKSRFGDVNKNPKFMIGLDRPKMRFYELNNNNVSWSGSSAPNKAPSAPAAPPLPKTTKPTTNSNNGKGIKI